MRYEPHFFELTHSTLFRMICPRCGTTNPAFFDKCIECGAILNKEGEIAARRRKYLLAGIAGIVLIVVIAGAVIAVPAVSHGLKILSHLGESSQSPQTSTYSIGEPAQYSDLQLTVTAAREGSQFNDRGFYLVTISLQNLKADGTLHFTTNDFILIDSDGHQYQAAGIGDGLSYDLNTGSTGSVDLRYIISQDSKGFRLRFDPSGPLGSAPEGMSYSEFIL